MCVVSAFMSSVHKDKVLCTTVLKHKTPSAGLLHLKSSAIFQGCNLRDLAGGGEKM